MAYRLAIVIMCVVLCVPNGAHAGPLHDAAKAGDVQQIKLLLDQGADINENSLATPLYFAINTEHAEAAQLLIERGADVNGQSIWGMPLHAAATKGLAPIATLLLGRGAAPDALWNTLTPLHLAARYGGVDVALVLIDYGANVNALDSLDEPPLHLAIIHKHSDVADLLRERGAKAPAAETIDSLIASADLKHGFDVALRCRGCHSIEREAKVNSGPPLWEIVARPKASYPDFMYSDALKALTGNWTYADLNDYIAHPAWTVPGVAMKMPGIHDPKERADLIAFLRTLSDHPAPLP